MIMDCDKYVVNKPFVERWFINRKYKHPIEALASITSATSVPCIVIAYWIGELFGFDDEVNKRIAMLKDFYGYTDVVNKPANAPI